MPLPSKYPSFSFARKEKKTFAPQTLFSFFVLLYSLCGWLLKWVYLQQRPPPRISQQRTKNTLNRQRKSTRLTPLNRGWKVTRGRNCCRERSQEYKLSKLPQAFPLHTIQQANNNFYCPETKCLRQARWERKVEVSKDTSSDKRKNEKVLNPPPSLSKNIYAHLREQATYCASICKHMCF